jgi:hypothetical protein
VGAATSKARELIVFDKPRSRHHGDADRNNAVQRYSPPRLDRYRDDQNPTRGFRLHEQLSNGRCGHTPSGRARLQPRGRSLPHADARRVLVSRLERRRRRWRANAESDRLVGEPDGRRDAPAHRQLRNGVRTLRRRLETRRTGRGRSASDAARRFLRSVAARDHGSGPDRSRRGQGRQIPAAAAGLRGRRARWIYGRQIADLWCGLRRARFSISWRDRPGRLADEDDASVSAVSGGQPAKLHLRQWLSPTYRHHLRRHSPVLQ